MARNHPKAKADKKFNDEQQQKWDQTFVNDLELARSTSLTNAINAFRAGQATPEIISFLRSKGYDLGIVGGLPETPTHSRGIEK